MSTFKGDPLSDQIDDTDADGDGKGPKALRDHAKNLQQQLDAALAENVTLKKSTRTNDLAVLLQKFKARPSLARFYDGADVTETAVQAWLEENKDDFNWEPPSDDGDEGEDEADPEETNQVRRINRATTSAPPAKNEAGMLQKLKTGKYEDLVREGYLPDMR